MPQVEATRQLTAAVDRLSSGQHEITETLRGVRAATEELSREVAADREEYTRRLSEAAQRTEVATQVRGTRRRIVAVLVVLLVVLGGVASTGYVLVTRARDAAATRAQFDALARERAANCQVSQARTADEVAFVRGELAADQAALALLTGPAASDNARSFAHTVFDGRIGAEQTFLRTYPAAPLTCTVPTR